MTPEMMKWPQAEAEAAPKKPEEFENKALESEKGALEKFYGKTRKLGQVMMLVSALTFGVGIAKEAFAGEKESDAELLQRLNDLPETAGAITPAQNRIMKERAVRAEIQRRSLETEKQGTATYDGTRTTAQRILEKIDQSTIDPSILKVLQEMAK